MTIAVGFCGNAGIVLAADSQETISGYTKGFRGKIHSHIFPDTQNCVCFAGSGVSDYIDTAMEKATDGLSTIKTLPEIKSKLECNLLGFFDTHLARYPEHERPDVELLIGVTTGVGAYRLYHYRGTAFHAVDHKAIGAGILLANSLISRHSPKLVGASTEEMASLAVYILSRVKTEVDTCGGQTDLIALRKNGDIAFTDFGAIQTAEREMERIETEIGRNLTEKLCSIPVNLTWMNDATRKIKSTQKAAKK